MESLPLSVMVSFFMYCFIQGITPGPANFCSLSTTLKYGVFTALRQWAGLLLGFFIVSFVTVGFVWGANGWLGQLLPILSLLGAAYVVWLAWKMLRPAHGEVDANLHTPTFASGVFVQVTNVKIALMCLTALVTYITPYTQHLGIFLVVGILMPLIGVSCNMVWIVAGSCLQAWYAKHSRVVDAFMAAALLMCAFEMVAPLFL